MNFDYKAKYPGMMKYIDGFNKFSINAREEEWFAQARKNMPYLKNYPMATDLKGTGIGKTGVIVGSGPSLRKNIDELKSCDNRFVIVAVNSALPMLVEHSIEPDFVFCLESGDHILDEMTGHEGLKLILVPIANHGLLKSWKGEIYFWPMQTGALGEEVRKAYDLKKDMILPYGSGNVFNTAFTFVYTIMWPQQYIFVGNDLSFDGEDYYATGKPAKESDLESPLILKDINGKTVRSNSALVLYKGWLEYCLSELEGEFVNASEAGVFGVGKDEFLPYIKQMTLKSAIDYFKEEKTDGTIRRN